MVRATLPPSWTPSFTPPPSPTPTATPVTPTLTPTDVPSFASLCDSFDLTYDYEDGHVFGWNDAIALVFGTQIASVRDPATQNVISLTVRFLATQDSSGENQGVQLVGGQVYAIELPVHLLPGPGDYTWKVAVYGDGIGENCLHTGRFGVTQTVDDLLTATALHALDLTATAAATPEPTSEIPILSGIP